MTIPEDLFGHWEKLLITQQIERPDISIPEDFEFVEYVYEPPGVFAPQRRGHLHRAPLSPLKDYIDKYNKERALTSKQPASIVDIKKYFSTDLRPVSAAELNTFWKDLTEKEKDFYKYGIGEILGL